jgi:hypothetical protein
MRHNVPHRCFESGWHGSAGVRGRYTEKAVFIVCWNTLRLSAEFPCYSARVEYSSNPSSYKGFPPPLVGDGFS